MPGSRLGRAPVVMIDHEPQELPVVSVELEEPLLTIEDIAEMLAVTPAHVCAYATRGASALPSVVVDDGLRFYPSDVAVWVAHERERSLQ